MRRRSEEEQEVNSSEWILETYDQTQRFLRAELVGVLTC